MPGSELRTPAARAWGRKMSRQSRGLFRDVAGGVVGTGRFLARLGDELTGASAMAHGDPVAWAMLLAPGGIGKIGKYTLERALVHPFPGGSHLGRLDEGFLDARGKPHDIGPTHEHGSIYNLRHNDELIGSAALHNMQLYPDTIERDILPMMRAAGASPHDDYLLKMLDQNPSTYVGSVFLKPEYRNTEAALALSSPIRDLARQGHFPWGDFQNPALRKTWARQVPSFLRWLAQTR